MEAIKKSNRGILIYIQVSPNSKEERIKGYDEWRKRILVDMREKPERFRVNKELIKFFSSLFNTPSNCVRIVEGEKSTLKTILVEGISEEYAEEILSRYI
ncbi:YggU family protein [Euryarchaeota archaeon ex4484_178]|nr:MAG: YggU family protein [Euryarchaeota archaeon ex4484_178]